MTIASLPMYDLPELRAETDALWAGLAAALERRGVERVPPALCRDRPLAGMWLDPELILSQTCGYPLVRELRGRVQVIATPRYRVAACEGSWYRSLVVVGSSTRAESIADLAGSICAANEPNSHSGMNAMRALVAPLAGGRPFFRRVVWTGAHRQGLELLAAGEVDVAAIDCVTFALVERARPELVRGLRVIGRTEACPGLPFITRATASPAELERMRDALSEIAADPSLARARDALLLDGFDLVSLETYRRVEEMEERAVALGYPALA